MCWKALTKNTSLCSTMQVAPGKHQLRVQVISDADSTDHSATIAGEFVSGKEQMLQIYFDKRGEMNLTLE